MAVQSLPDTWDWVPLGELGKYINGRAFKPSEWEETGLPIIRIQNLTNHDAQFNFYSKPVKDKYYVKNGDLLISWSATLGAYIWDRGDALLNQHIFRVEVNTNRVDKLYLLYVILGALDELADRTHGSTMRHVTKRDFEAFKVRVPRSLTEQRRIASRIEVLLIELQEALEIHQRIQENTDRLTNAILAVTFEDLNNKWPKDTLGNEELCQVIPGQHILSKDYTDSPPGIPYITGPADFGSKVAVITKWTQSPKVLSQPGDILFTVKGSGVGKVNCTPTTENCAIGRQIMAIRPNTDRLTRDYLFYALLGRFQEFQKLRQGAAIPGIRKEHVQAIELPLPDIATQDRIVAYLEAVLAEVTAMQVTLARDSEMLDQVEHAILAKAFRGEL